MRKHVLAAALTVAFPAAFAQTAMMNGIELYGVVDMGYEYVDNGVSTNRIQSGISTGSRWGLRGREDLGSGYSAIFTLESRIEVDTGQVQNNGSIYWCGTRTIGTTAVPSCPGVTLVSPLPPTVAPAVLGGMNTINSQLLQAVTTVNSANALFDRQAYAGLITPFGAVIAGRQYTPGYETFVKFNSFYDSFGGNPGQIAAINLRANNAVQYRAELKGFTLGAMYGFGGAEAPAASRTERVAPPSEGDDFWGIELQYVTDWFGIAGAYQNNRTVTYSNPTENSKGLETYNVGGWVGLGNFKFYGHYLKSINDNPVLTPTNIQNIVVSTGGSPTAIAGTLGSLYINSWDVDALRGVAGPIDLSVYHLGLEWSLGFGKLIAAINWAEDTARSQWATEDADVQTYAVGYYHYLSKRTWLYGQAALANNGDQSRIALGGAGYRGGWTTNYGEDSRQIQLGIRHLF
jgi:predicted porin